MLRQLLIVTRLMEMKLKTAHKRVKVRHHKITTDFCSLGREGGRRGGRGDSPVFGHILDNFDCYLLPC